MNDGDRTHSPVPIGRPAAKRQQRPPELWPASPPPVQGSRQVHLRPENVRCPTAEGNVSSPPDIVQPAVTHSKGNGEDTSQRECAAIAYEMAQALEAVTNYVAAAQRIASGGAGDSTSRLSEILEKAVTQTLRVNKAFRLLRAHTDHLERS